MLFNLGIDKLSFYSRMHNNDVNNFTPGILGGIYVTEIGDNSTIENCPFIWGVLISIRCFPATKLVNCLLVTLVKYGGEIKMTLLIGSLGIIHHNYILGVEYLRK